VVGVRRLVREKCTVHFSRIAHRALRENCTVHFSRTWRRTGPSRENAFVLGPHTGWEAQLPKIKLTRSTFIQYNSLKRVYMHG
jgi:hypothetical protein